MLTEYTIKSTLSSILFDNVLCESIHEKHLVNYFYEELMLEKLLVGEPITVPELRKLLHQKIVNFEFIKLNGNIRPARGTTVMDKIPASDHPKGVRPSSKKVATFWDLSKKAWRSVSSRSKEIVLKKNDDDKAIVTVRDKKDNEPNQVIVKKKEEPIKQQPQNQSWLNQLILLHNLRLKNQVMNQKLILSHLKKNKINRCYEKTS
jgi:hypothetical protein